MAGPPPGPSALGRLPGPRLPDGAQVGHLRRGCAPPGGLLLPGHPIDPDQPAASPADQGNLRPAAAAHGREDAGGPGDAPEHPGFPDLPVGVRQAVPLRPGCGPPPLLGTGAGGASLSGAGGPGDGLGGAPLGRLCGASGAVPLRLRSHHHRPCAARHHRRGAGLLRHPVPLRPSPLRREALRRAAPPVGSGPGPGAGGEVLRGDPDPRRGPPGGAGGVARDRGLGERGDGGDWESPSPGSGSRARLCAATPGGPDARRPGPAPGSGVPGGRRRDAPRSPSRSCGPSTFSPRIPSST